jgi:polyisoprenoid-binding protein YceI
MNQFVALALLALLAPTASMAATWQVDPAKSTIGFSGIETGTPFSGHFKTFTAKIDFDPAHPDQGHADIVIDLASAASGDKQRDTALPQSDWFNTAAFPQAHFVATRFDAKGGKSYEAVGALTIRGITKPLTLPFTLATDGAATHAKGHVQLIRTDFGVGQGDWASDQWVALEVGVDIDLTATSPPQAGQ